MEKVGLITFHASYNFGTVMQAWALQSSVAELGYDCDIINFRTTAQKDKYSLFPLRGGVKLILRNLIQIRYIVMKRDANKKYEDFITHALKLSREYNTITELERETWDYDIYLAGSDQIWAHAVPEFVSSAKDVRPAYYFSFAEGRKISYASSTGTSSYDEILPYKEYLKKFSHIAVREENGRQIIEEMTGRCVSVVLDPTYLVPHRKWVEIAAKQKKKADFPYILIYSLQGRKKAKKWKEIIEKLHAETGFKVITVSPFSPISGDYALNRADAGPLEILSLFANAEYIFTDTFHGMSFSIHFRKQFVMFEDTAADYRKRNILEKFDLTERETNDITKCCALISQKIDYSAIENVIEREIDASRDYLRLALEDR